MDTSMRTAIINAFNLTTLTKEEQNKMIAQIGDLIFQSVLVRVIPDMSNEKQDELQKMLDADATPDAILGYLTREVPNFAEIVTEEAQTFKKESEDVMSKLAR